MRSHTPQLCKDFKHEGAAADHAFEPARLNQFLIKGMPFDPGVLLVSPAHDNIHQHQKVLDVIGAIAPPNGHRKRRAAIRTDKGRRLYGWSLEMPAINEVFS